MASFDRIKEGQVLYTVTRQRASNARITRQAVHAVQVISVDRAARCVTASWNCNPARTYRESQVAKWKINKPNQNGG